MKLEIVNSFNEITRFGLGLLRKSFFFLLKKPEIITDLTVGQPFANGLITTATCF